LTSADSLKRERRESEKIRLGSSALRLGEEIRIQIFVENTLRNNEIPQALKIQSRHFY
jgi:hypothetical protein